MPQPFWGLWVALSFFTSPFFSAFCFSLSLCLSLSLSWFVRTQGVVVRGNCGRKRKRNKHHIPMRVMSNLPHYQHKPSFHLFMWVSVCVFLSLSLSLSHKHTIYYSLGALLRKCLLMTHQMHLRFGVHIRKYELTTPLLSLYQHSQQ